MGSFGKRKAVGDQAARPRGAINKVIELQHQRWGKSREEATKLVVGELLIDAGQ